MRDMIKNMLAKENYGIFEADDGDEALRILQSVTPDLILMDLMMPKMTGWETTKKIKEDVFTGGIPVIYLSVLKKNDPEVQRKNHEAGGELHIQKPFERGELINTIQNYIGKSY